MTIANNDFQLILPELVFLAGTFVTLLLGLFAPKHKEQIIYLFAQISIVAAIVAVWQLYGVADAIAFSGHYRHDGVTSVLQLVILVLGFFLLMYSRDYVKELKIQFLEYYVLALLSMLGMLVLVSAYSFLTLYLGLELLSLPLYALAAMRRERVECAEAGLKYFIMGAIASGMLLYGLSMVYGATGEIQLNLVTEAISQMDSGNLLIVFGLVFISVGVVFKLGGVPFHMWVPDVYHGAPASVTLLISTAPKVAAFGLAVRLFVDALPGFHMQWQHILIVVSLLSMGLGNFVAIAQSNLKRMLAYSSIAHMGYMLLGLLAGTKSGYASAMFYMIVYSIMSLGAFGMLTLLSRAGVDVENIEDFKGLNQRNPWLALMMLLVMFSMAGIPPIVGFFAKVGVLEALINVDLVWLAAVALLFAIVGAYYYIRVVKVMYFDTADDPSPLLVAGTDSRIAISVNGIAVLLLGIFPSVLFDLCHKAFS